LYRPAFIVLALGSAGVLLVVFQNHPGAGNPSRSRNFEAGKEPLALKGSTHTSASTDYVSASSQVSAWVPTHNLVAEDKALPCTGPDDPINFEVFSAGARVQGLPLNAMLRRCDSGSPKYEAPANYVSYTYGRCEIPEDAHGCAPPLEIQTWPACQRSIADYRFEGRPLPYRSLGKSDGAEVVEIDFLLDHRIEVYTRSSTIVIYATDTVSVPGVIRDLRSQKKGSPPSADPEALDKSMLATLGPAAPEAIQGDLPCGN
jgi:hypothetical protein